MPALATIAATRPAPCEPGRFGNPSLLSCGPSPLAFSWAAFDPEATRTLGQAFDMACALLGHTPQPTAVREAIAKSIIEAAKAGERDPVRLREAGLAALSNSNAA
jgi:hypothetical protein